MRRSSVRIRSLAPLFFAPKPRIFCIKQWFFGHRRADGLPYRFGPQKATKGQNIDTLLVRLTAPLYRMRCSADGLVRFFYAFPPLNAPLNNFFCPPCPDPSGEKPPEKKILKARRDIIVPAFTIRHPPSVQSIARDSAWNAIAPATATLRPASRTYAPRAVPRIPWKSGGAITRNGRGGVAGRRGGGGRGENCPSSPAYRDARKF